jgi:hypothetical protein
MLANNPQFERHDPAALSGGARASACAGPGHWQPPPPPPTRCAHLLGRRDSSCRLEKETDPLAGPGDRRTAPTGATGTGSWESKGPCRGCKLTRRAASRRQRRSSETPSHWPRAPAAAAAVTGLTHLHPSPRRGPHWGYWKFRSFVCKILHHGPEGSSDSDGP